MLAFDATDSLAPPAGSSHHGDMPDCVASPEPSRRVLIVLHQEQSTPGRIGRLLRERGIALDIRRPRFGDPLPATLSDHLGAIVFGGPMSANDDDDYVRREIDWIGVPLAEDKPFLGICLGAQMLARHLGQAGSCTTRAWRIGCRRFSPAGWRAARRPPCPRPLFQPYFPRDAQSVMTSAQ